jgi:C4-dicarboxylate-specific signal transduction histidine kinase
MSVRLLSALPGRGAGRAISWRGWIWRTECSLFRCGSFITQRRHRPRASELLNPAVESNPDGNLREVVDAVDVIARRSSGLMSFVERYRTLAELPPPSPESLSVADFIHRIDQLMRPTLEARGIAYSSSVEPPDLTLRADREMLEQVLINLIHNAIEALCASEALAVGGH